MSAEMSGADSNRPFSIPKDQYNGPRYVSGSLVLDGQTAGTYYFNKEGNFNYETFSNSLSSYTGYLTIPQGSIISDVVVYAQPALTGALTNAVVGATDFSALAITTGNAIGTSLGGTGLAIGAIPLASLNTGSEVRIGADVITGANILSVYVNGAVTTGKIHATVAYYPKSS